MYFQTKMRIARDTWQTNDENFDSLCEYRIKFSPTCTHGSLNNFALTEFYSSMDTRYSENYFCANTLTFDTDFMKESGIRFGNEFLAFHLHTITNVPREVNHKRRTILTFTPATDGLFPINAFLRFFISRMSANATTSFPQMAFLVIHDHNTTKYACVLCNVGIHLFE